MLGQLFAARGERLFGLSCDRGVWRVGGVVVDALLLENQDLCLDGRVTLQPGVAQVLPWCPGPVVWCPRTRACAEVVTKLFQDCLDIALPRLIVVGGSQTVCPYVPVSIYDFAANLWLDTSEAVAVTALATVQDERRSDEDRRSDELVLFGLKADAKIACFSGGRWSAVPSPPYRRSGFAASALGASLYVSGGIGHHFQEAEEVMKFDSKWISVASLKKPRRSHAMLAADGRLYVMGGYTRGAKPCYDVEEYDPWLDAWSVIDTLPLHEPRHAAAAIGHVIYLFGVGGSWRYDVRARNWTALSPMKTPRLASQAAVFGDKVVVVGGFCPLPCGVVELYDPSHDTWQTLAPLTVPRVGHAVALLPS